MILSAAAILLTATQTDATLVLDTRAAPAQCAGDDGSGDVTVCARRDRLPTRLPMRRAGVAGTLLIEPSGSDELFCNADFIARSGLVARRNFTISSIGPVDVPASAAATTVEVAGQTSKAEVRWGRGRGVMQADCVTGPRAFQGTTIRFVLGPPRAGAQTFVMPISRRRSEAPYITIPVGEDEILARIELDHATSVLTAPAARIVAAALGGTVTGAPRDDHIMYGVERPVRRIETLRPLMLGPVALTDLWARVDDYGSANGLRAIDPSQVREGDIVASAKRERVGRVRLLRIGRNALAGCESVTVDTRRRMFTFVC